MQVSFAKKKNDNATYKLHIKRKSEKFISGKNWLIKLELILKLLRRDNSKQMMMVSLSEFIAYQIEVNK